MNETTVTESTVPFESVPETMETVEIVEIIVDRPFMSTRLEDYTVLEGFQLLNFVLLLGCVFLALIRR